MPSSTPDAPPPLRLVALFADTVDVEEGTDELREPSAFRAWLVGQGLAAPGLRIRADELELARRLRDALREVLIAHHSPPAERPTGTGSPAARLAAATAALPYTLTFRDGRPVLAPAGTGVRRALAEVFSGLVQADADGDWERLKICAMDDCAVVFFDGSKNRSRHWCDMAVCGNRAKTRAYRSRRRAAGR